LESTVTLYGKSYRAVVVHSSSHDKRRQKRLDKAIATSFKSMSDEISKLETVYFCKADAEIASKKAKALSTKLHRVIPLITPFEARKRGRPPSKAPAPTTTRYRIDWKLELNTEAVERERQAAGCFVLLSNVPIDGEDGLDCRALLQTYKGQYGVESDFAFLKDPLIVNDTFLKKPHRIDALGMILVIALMVWRLMERSMRHYLSDTNKNIQGWCGRVTQKPTSFMMTTVIGGIMVAKIANQRILLRKPNVRQTDFLVALGVGWNVFFDPNVRCHPKIPSRKPEKG
jgi:transposase